MPPDRPAAAAVASIKAWRWTSGLSAASAAPAAATARETPRPTARLMLRKRGRGVFDMGTPEVASRWHSTVTYRGAAIQHAARFVDVALLTSRAPGLGPQVEQEGRSLRSGNSAGSAPRERNRGGRERSCHCGPAVDVGGGEQQHETGRGGDGGQAYVPCRPVQQASSTDGAGQAKVDDGVACTQGLPGKRRPLRGDDRGRCNHGPAHLPEHPFGAGANGKQADQVEPKARPSAVLHKQ